jgi:Ca2+/Na+ antiporter
MLLLVSLGVIVSFILLAEVTNKFFVFSLEKIASRLKLSPDVAGASLLAIGSSAGELFVALISVFRPDSVPDIGAGTIVGSAIFNILMITGISLMYRSGKIHWQPLIRDLLFYGNAVLLMFLIFKDGRVDLAESIMLLAAYGKLNSIR